MNHDLINSFRPYIKAAVEQVEKMRPIILAASKEAERIKQQFAPIAIKIREDTAIAVVKIAKVQENKKINVALMAENGWFPSWYTFLFRPREDHNSMDDFMIENIDSYWVELKEKISEFCPNRKHILDVAFELHEKKNFIASIPILLAQSDGICSEEFSHFFSRNNDGNRAADEVLNKFEIGDIELNLFTEYLLEPFKANLQVSNSSSKASKAAKMKGPNRHGIIHGSRKHLDYGTKINGYKAISFLAFIVYSTKDEFKKT
jgi:hypothetical protein